jgi:nucleoid-associated protein YgaU
MDFDYDGAEDLGGRILWGRVAVFGAALLLALLLGRCTAGGGGVSEARFSEVAASNSEAQAALEANTATIAQLTQQVNDLRNAATSTGGTGTTTPGTGSTEGAGTATTAPTTDAQGNQVYEVQPGDTLSTIAETVYGNPAAFGVIASANNISGSQPLQVGDQLIIPPNPDAQQ